jgi:serine/threonine protein phosphatase PrpC
MEQEGQGPGAAVGAAIWLTDAKTSTWLAMTVGDCKIMVATRSSLAWRIRWESPNQSYAHCGLTPPAGVSVDSPANMVGCGMPLPALMHSITLAQSERIILCSDGFYTAFNDVQLQDILSQTPQPLSTSSAQIWCEKAQHLGALDDVTLVLVEQVLAPTVASSRWWALALVSVTAMGMALAWFW